MSDTKQVPNIISYPLFQDLHVRVSRLEQEGNERRTELAVLKTNVSYVKEGVDTIKGGINKILWALGLLVLTWGATYVLSEGLPLP